LVNNIIPQHVIQRGNNLLYFIYVLFSFMHIFFALNLYFRYEGFYLFSRWNV